MCIRDRLEARGDLGDLPIVKIKSSDRVAGFRPPRFLFDAERLWRFSLRIELDNSVAFGVVDGVCENAGAFFLQRSLAQFLDQVMSVKNIVPEHQRAAAGADKLLADQERLGNTFGLWLNRVLEMDSVAGAIAE